jgi:predicted ABC-type ATPase
MQSANNDTLRASTPTLIIIRGIPGSGKSFLTAALQDSLGKEKVVVLDPDAIDYSSSEYRQFSQQLSSEGVDTKFHPFRYSRSRAFDAIVKRKIIIWNQGFIDFGGFKKTVDSLQTYANEHDTTLPTLVVEVEVHHETAKSRIADRVAAGGHHVPDEALADYAQRYQSFADKGYVTVTVDGHDDIDMSVATVQQALHALK